MVERKQILATQGAVERRRQNCIEKLHAWFVPPLRFGQLVIQLQV